MSDKHAGTSGTASVSRAGRASRATGFGAVACESLGLGLLAFAWASMARPSSPLAVALGTGDCEVLSLASRVGALLAAACVAMLCLKDPYRGAPLSRRSAKLFLVSAIASEVLCVASLAVLAWWGAGAPVDGGVGIVAAALAGLAVTVLLLLWLDELAGDGSGPSARAVAGALAVFGLLSPLLLVLDRKSVV